MILPRIAKNFAFLTLLLLCLFSSTGAEPLKSLTPVQQQPYDVAISLGFNCQVAWQLKLNSLRKNAYPFDFVVTSFESIVNFLMYKGEHFLDKDKLMFIHTDADITPIPYLAKHAYVLDLAYGIGLLHDFPLEPSIFLYNYDEVKAKYDRRVQRFFNLLQTNKRILFIRLGLLREQAIYLDYVLHSLYPNLSYTLLVLNDNEESKVDWGLERVKNLYLRQPVPFFWMGDDQAWREVFYLFPVSNTLAPNYDDYE